jgi:hypothetical protein
MTQNCMNRCWADIRPWRVERVTLNREAMAIEVELTCPPDVWAGRALSAMRGLTFMATSGASGGIWTPANTRRS